ncbi:MAG: spermidine/putrescine ABC transporter substrate-binding protein [Verrucomicrobia bacterium]|nr:spermidine/putrescine ABC transporter substrate-binding protein [Verrucomicrobiota bacterium]
MKTKTTQTILSAAAAAALVFTATAHAVEKLNIYCWSEYIPQDVIDDFAKETGIKVSVENYASNEEMLAKLGAGGGSFDIIQPSEYVVEALVNEKLLRPLDKKAIPNLKNIDSKFLNMSFDPGNKYSVPFMAGTVGIVVNTDLVKEDIKSFSDVFKPANKGKIVALDDAREIISWALLSKGIPVNDVSDKNLEKAKGVLSDWIPLIKVYDSDSPKTALLNGDVAIGVVWGGEGAILLNENKKFRWVIPAEGTHLFIDSLAIPKTAKNFANAEKFMNYILQPEVSKKISEAFPYLNPNMEAVKLLTEEQRNNSASFPTAKEISKMETFKDIGERGSVIEEIVTSLKVE